MTVRRLFPNHQYDIDGGVEGLGHGGRQCDTVFPVGVARYPTVRCICDTRAFDFLVDVRHFGFGGGVEVFPR